MKKKKRSTALKWPLSRRVEIHWQDAGSSTGWRSKDETAKMDPLACRSLGYLVIQTKKKIVLAASQSVSNGDIGDRMVIPRSWVLKILNV